MTRPTRARLLPVAALLAAAAGAGTAPAPARAQSLLSAAGLGLPVSPVGARARALGSSGIGLLEAALVPTDPAAAADLRVPSLTFTTQTSWTEISDGGATSDAQGTVFPLLGVAYPVGGWGMATLSLNGVLDQRFAVEQERVLQLESEVARVTDRFRSDGGVSALRIGFARRIAPSFSVGANVGTYLGSVTRTFTRTFDSTAVESVPDFEIDGRWSFSGLLGSVGAQLDVIDVLRFSASVSFSGTLEADPADGTDGAGDRYDIPLQYRAGVSGILAPGLILHASADYADWSGAGETLEGATGRSVLAWGGGLELDRATLFGKPTPFRLGYRSADLPFGFVGEEASESAFTGGLGVNLVQGQGIVLARVDLAVERGSRDAGTLQEDFWRAVFTARVAGF